MVAGGIAGLMLGGILGTVAATGLGEIANTETLYAGAYEIEPRGSRYIESGKIDGASAYVVYRRMRDGYKAESIQLGGTKVIRCGAGETPRVEIFRKEPKGAWRCFVLYEPRNQYVIVTPGDAGTNSDEQTKERSWAR